ncbi:MAG: SDR family oxidoreductase [Microthrixaceae bacterium]
MNSQPNDLALQLLAATELLEAVAQDRSVLAHLSTDQRSRFLSAAGDVFCPDVEERRQQIRARRRKQRLEKAQQDETVLNSTGIRTLRAQEVFTSPNIFPPVGFVQTELTENERPAHIYSAGQTLQLQHCYVCKVKYSQIHFFYDQLCPTCADLNYAKRTESADLHGRVALLTGGRVKIGYQAGIKLLRAGAHLVVTTRFPQDSAMRYSQEPDFLHWQDRLEIYGLDLRHTPSVESFCSHMLATHSRLDYIINNACQTVRRPPEFYEHMMELERGALNELLQANQQDAPVTPARAIGASALVRSASGAASSAEISQLPLLPEDHLRLGLMFPGGVLDQDLQQVDLREINSWRLNLAQVSTVEMIETQLVNAVAPFVLNARLKPLMLQTPDQDKHIVNVSAVEGQFYRRFKTTKHPHTNMAKAALNMMTRTSAAEYHADGIHMNSVDTGWVSDEDPVHIAERKTAEHGFHPPLDIVDGAARIVDPIIAGELTGNMLWGQFLKDYFPTDW